MSEHEKMDYWQLRKAVSKVVPRMTQLISSDRKAEIVREKGRKKNYSQFNLRHKEWRKQERLLNTEEINSFLEISVRASACPMPFNMDIWDGLLCIAKGQRITTKRGLIPIEEVVVGDTVLSYNEVTKTVEWKLVTNTSKTIKKKIVELDTEQGTLRLTPDHRVFTQRGWVEAGQLMEDDILYSYEER